MQNREPSLESFNNEPYIDFSKEESRKALEAEVAKVGPALGKNYPLVVGGKEIYTEETIQSTNPANASEVIGIACQAGPEHLELAIEAALAAYAKWKDVPYQERAQVLLRAAQTSRMRKLELAVWMSKENGKSISEAVADVAEGIDFMEYYARHMLRIGGTPEKLHPIAGEKVSDKWTSLGVGAVISPWNFPFAILAGMASAAIVTGNTIIVKPSNETPIIAYHVQKILEEAGVPPGVCNYLPGKSAKIGNAISEHKKIRFIAFTGSTDAGRDIYERAARMPSWQKWFKRVILETGGKNHVIVCDDADVDKAVSGVARAAFGYSGQKCSACSVALVQAEVYEEFRQKLVEYARTLKIGEGTKDAANYVSPAINQQAFTKIAEYVEIGKSEGKLLLGGGKANGEGLENGYFFEPTIFEALPADSRLHKEEIFGPVLAIRKFTTFDEALHIANATDYGLTGGVFTQSEENKEKAMKEFQVGNLYFNKASGGSTGAMVGRHPFGGFNLSGTDSKAGGPHYLYLFMQEKSITEVL